ENLALGGLLQSRDRIEESSLTAAGLSHNGDELAWVDVEVKPFEHNVFLSVSGRGGFADVVDGECVLGPHSLLRSVVGCGGAVIAAKRIEIVIRVNIVDVEVS